MHHIINFLFEARILKKILRTGYQFLEAGGESVAEHSFLAAVIGFVMAQAEPETDETKLLLMCLLHDLPESRVGDLNYVQKRYTAADEAQALADALAALPFKDRLIGLISEFNQGETREAKLARDADQLALLVDLKALLDTGYRSPESWIDPVMERLTTDTGKRMAAAILQTDRDRWWREIYVDSAK